MTRIWATLVLLALLAPSVQALDLVPIEPSPGDVVRTDAPVFRFAFANGTGVAVDLELDGLAIEDEENLQVNGTGFGYALPPILALAEGNHTLNVTASDGAGGSASYSLAFSVNLTVPPAPREPVDLGLVVGLVSAGLALAAGAATGTYVHLRRRRGFTFRKHFLRNPGHLRFLALYLPAGTATVLTLGALFFVSTWGQAPRYATEFVLVVGGCLAVGPFGLSSLRANTRTRAAERAFAQFLFELADAVRGGINPVKAVQELAMTGEGILKQPLQQAADALRLGRPMEEALRSMVAGLGSPLVLRYASLVGEASSMGGSVAGVLQRAAKDMDDLVKIQAERRRSLRQPVFTMYMAFGVLLIMVLQVISFAPNVGDLDFGALGIGGGAQVAKMPLPLMQERFFHLLLVNAVGAGLLVGSFTHGRVRDGLLHAMVMVAAAVVIYPLAVQ